MNEVAIPEQFYLKEVFPTLEMEETDKSGFNKNNFYNIHSNYPFLFYIY